MSAGGEAASRSKSSDDIWAGFQDWPHPHPAMPKATARQGTRRIPTKVRALFGKQLSRELAASLIEAGELEAARCSVVWNVDQRPVVQPVGDVSIPPGLGVLPVRRIGTHQAATHSIAMYPVLRDGFVLMLSVESRLELAWLHQLDFDRRVSALYAQPFAMVWRHELGNLVRVPDLAAVIDGRLAVFEVKPGHRLADERTRLGLDFAAYTFGLAGVPFQVLSDVSPQRRHNLLLLSRYRCFNPFLAVEVEAVLAAQPPTVGDAVRIVEGLHTSAPVGGGQGFGLASLRVANEVVRHLLASGGCGVDLDEPLSLGSELSWQPEEWRTGWVA